MLRRLYWVFLFLVPGFFLPSAYGQGVRERVLKTIDHALTAMTRCQRHGGWGTVWSVDGKIVWGEYRPIPDDWITVQAPATPTTAETYLRAGQLLQDSRWIAVAEEAHTALCRLQSVEGGFPHEGPPSAGHSKHASFDDGVTTETLNFFIRWWHHAETKESRSDVDHIGAFILTSQYVESGGWPQSYPPPSGYGRCITFNDGNISNIIHALFNLARETGEPQYRDAAIRGGDCILQLQGGEGESIWAQQYDPETLQPAWARKFEPPGYTPAESSAVCNTLVELFVETGDNRYIESLGRALAWYETHQLENGKFARLYEPGSQRPVYGRRDRAIKVYDFDKACSGYAWQGNWYPHHAAAAYEEIRANGGAAYRKANTMTKSSNVIRPATLVVTNLCDSLDKTGFWTRKPNSKQLTYYEKQGVDPELPLIDLSSFNANMRLLLDFIAAPNPL